ncbi:MAG: hypothetical protein QXR58_02300, partial [Candidatus Micrarchaeaceae archaeon]
MKARDVHNKNDKLESVGSSPHVNAQKYTAVVIHYGEIGVKGRNRGMFVNTLYRNITASLRMERYAKLENDYDRLVLRLEKGSDISSITERLKHVFGIAWFTPVLIVENDRKKIVEAALSISKGLDAVKIVPHRSNKEVAFNSQDLV